MQKSNTNLSKPSLNLPLAFLLALHLQFSIHLWLLWRPHAVQESLLRFSTSEVPQKESAPQPAHQIGMKSIFSVLESYTKLNSIKHTRNPLELVAGQLKFLITSCNSRKEIPFMIPAAFCVLGNLNFRGDWNFSTASLSAISIFHSFHAAYSSSVARVRLCNSDIKPVDLYRSSISVKCLQVKKKRKIVCLYNKQPISYLRNIFSGILLNEQPTPMSVSTGTKRLSHSSSSPSHAQASKIFEQLIVF